MNRYSNTAFIPYAAPASSASEPMFNIGSTIPAQPDLSASVTLTPETQQPDAWQLKQQNQQRRDYFTGIYNWANAHRAPSCAAEAKRIFGDNLCPADKEEAALYLGQSLLDATGYTQDPAGYYRAIGKELPTGYADYATLLRRIGQDFIKDQQSLYDQNKKALAEVEKDIQETNNTLPSILAKSIRSAGGEKGEDLTPEYLQKLTKYGMAKGAVEAQHRAALAWSYMSAYMDAPDIDNRPLRERLLDVADALSDDEGKLDKLALATFALLSREKALELQDKNPGTVNHILSRLVHGIKSSFEEDADNNARENGIERIKALADATKRNKQSLQEVLESGNHIYGDKVETLLSIYREAVDLSKSTPEQANFIAKTLADVGGFAGEQVIPFAGSLAGALLSRGAGGGRLAQAFGSWAGGAYASYDSLMSRNYADAVRTGKINPEMYATFQSLAEAGMEGLFNVAGASAAGGAAARWIASRAAGARWLSNSASQAFIRSFGFVAVEGAGELAEEELSGMAGATINALARKFGVEVTPQAYKLGEAVGSMELHEIAGIFLYTALLHGVNVRDNFAKARAFAQNTDNLLKAGHTAAEAREVQLKTFEAEDKIQDIWLNKDLSEQQKRTESDKISREFFDWQKNYHEKQVMTLSNKELRARLAKQGVETRSEAEVKLDIENETDLQILKEHNVLQAIIVPGEKYQMSFYEKGEKQEDGKRSPGKIITQEWTREQLTNWLTFQKDTRYAREANELNAKIMANQLAHADNAQQLAIEYKSLGDNADYKVLKEIRTNGITPHFFKLAAQDALKKIRQNQAQGMSFQQALQQPSELVEGYSLGAVLQLGTAAAERQQQAANTTEGKLKGITKTSSVEFGAMNKVNRDGSAIVSYAKNRATILDFIEEIFEIQIKRLINGNNAKAKQLAAVIAHIESKLPGNIKLLQNKDNPSTSDFIEAFSKLATSAYLYQQQRLPLNPAGHQLVQTVARSVDLTRTFKVIGDAWNIFANSKEGKQYLQETGKGLADFLTQAGFTLDTAFDNFKADAQKRAEVIEARNWQPDIEQELDALLEEAEAESQLAEINQQEAKEPITIPADQSITGKEITIEPAPSEQEAGAPTTTTEATPGADLSGEKATTILSHMRDLIAKGKARVEHFAIVFREIPGLTEAQAIEQGIRTLTQRGEPTAAYTQGKLLAERCTDVQYLLLKEGKLTQKAKRDILAKPAASNVDAQGRPVGDKWPTVSKAKQGKLTTEQTRAAIYKALKLTTSKDSTRTPLRLIKHQIKRGRESFVSTTGTQLSIISRPSKEANLENIYSPITGHYTTQQQAGVHFPLWEQVFPVQMDKATTFDIDLADFRFLEKYPTQGKTFKEVVINGTRNTFATLEVDGQIIYFNLANIRNAIKQLATLARELGFPSQVKLHSWGPKSPIRITAEHNGWTWDYITMPLELSTPSDNIVTILLNPQDDSSTNFSIKAGQQEMQNVHNCVQELSTGVDGTLHNTAWGHDIIVPHGRIGKKGFGVNHMHEKRLLHGFTEDEAAFIIVCAMKAAETEASPIKQENSLWFERFGIRAVVAQNSPDDARLLTGFIWNTTGGKKAVDSDAANNAQRFYALDELRRVQVVGAALQKAVALFEQIVNNNPQNWEQIITSIVKELQTKQNVKAAGGVYEGSPLDAFSATNAQETNFSIRAANPSTLERFTADPLGERIVHTVRTEARRYARVLGDKTPQEQAMNAIASAESIIMAVDKYLHRPDKPVSRRHRDQLTKLRIIIEKYAQIIASGTPRSFKRISPAEQQELQAAIAELEAAELDTAETDPSLLIEDDKRMNKRTREARSREHHRAIVREAAKGRVYKVLAAMLDTTADALDDYLKDQLLTKLHRLTATVAIKRTPSKRLKGKMTAPMYRELEQAIQLMAYSTRQKEDAIDTIFSAHETLAQAIASNDDNLTRGNTLLIELAHQLEQEGTPVTAQTLTAALAAHEARVAIFADITSKNYEQTRTAANAIYHIIRYGRALWQQKHEAREAEIQTYLRHFLANTTAEQGKANAINEMLGKFKWRDALSLNATMNAAQTLLALSSYEPLRPIMQKVLEDYATASVARQKHLQEMRKQELYIFGRIIGIKPATQAGYSDKQLREISDKFDTFYTENNQIHDTGITVTWQERNEDGVLETYTSAPLKLTKWEALNLILSYRQDDYKTNAQIHGYTVEVLTKLENFIGTDLMDFGNAIQQALINDGTIAVYEEREGIPMRDNRFYWPGNININTLNTTRDEPLTNPYHPASGHDFLHTRVRHRDEISHKNALAVWRKAVADRANYVYSDPVTSQLESLLARKQFANRLRTLIGEGLYRQLKATIAEIKNASWQETSLQDVNNTIVATAFASKSLAVLSGNPGSLVRQLSAVANAGLMPGLTPRKFMQYAIRLKQGEGHIYITDILKLDSFTTRERDNAYVNEMLAMGNNVKFSRLMDWAKAGMNAMDKLDLLANAFSAAIVYNHKYDELKSLGTLTEDQIKKQCENAVAVYTKLLAQPLNRTDKSALYWKIGNDAIGRAVLFMSSESINKIGMLRANYIRMRNEGKNPAYALGAVLGTMGITVGLTAALTEAALAILTGSMPDDDDNIAAWAIALWLNASYGQYLGSLPLIGGVTDSFFSPYGGYFSGDFKIPGKDAWERGGKLIKMLTDDKTYTAAQWDKETTRFMRDFTAVLGFAGGAYSRWQLYSHAAAFAHSFTAALNVLYPIVRGAEAYSDPEPTSTRAKRKPRRSKSLIEKTLTPESK